MIFLATCMLVSKIDRTLIECQCGFIFGAPFLFLRRSMDDK